jgi:2'-5' RNA ligase
MKYVKLFEEFLNMNLEVINEKGGKYSYGCAMVNLDVPGMKDLQEKIDPEDLAGSGIESDHHVTLLYGLHDGGETHSELSKEQLSKLMNICKKDISEVRLYEVSAFKNSEYDVLKFKADSPGLHSTNGELTKAFEFTTDFPEYNPHATIAYLKPGTADKYIKEFKNIELKGKPSEIVYSRPSGEKVIEKLV